VAVQSNIFSKASAKTTVWNLPRNICGSVVIYLLAGAGLSLLVSAAPFAAFAQDVQLVHVDIQTVAQGYRVSKLTGRAVVNDKNETIGKIDDVVIGHGEGCSLFAVLQIGGFLGLGSRLVAIPYESLKIDQNGDKIELPGASKRQLEALAQFRYGG
jgi:sporulation protein YlmC with PRC-barrel domain